MSSKTNTDPLAKQRGENNAQWRMRLALAGTVQDNTEPRATPNVFTTQHGDYQDRFVMHAETATRAKALVNRGGDPVSRWEAAGKLEPHQMLAITLLRGLWDQVGIKQRVTANYGERIGGGDAEHAITRQIEARDRLHRIRDYFPAPLGSYFDVFENVVRHDWPAGVAGAGLGRSEKTAQARALTIVQFVADFIAMKELLT
jgi:hypothetical protein